MLEAGEQRTLGSAPDASPVAPDFLDDPAQDSRAAAYRRALRAELERRLAELATTPEDAFGGIGLGDAILATLLFVLLPALIVWMYR
jgi:hypothetical protein